MEAKLDNLFPVTEYVNEKVRTGSQPSMALLQAIEALPPKAQMEVEQSLNRVVENMSDTDCKEYMARLNVPKFKVVEFTKVFASGAVRFTTFHVDLAAKVLLKWLQSYQFVRVFRDNYWHRILDWKNIQTSDIYILVLRVYPKTVDLRFSGWGEYTMTRERFVSLLGKSTWSNPLTQEEVGLVLEAPKRDTSKITLADCLEWITKECCFLVPERWMFVSIYDICTQLL